MTHNFYITTDSFQESNLSMDDLRNLLGILYADIVYSRRHRGTSITVCSDVYETFSWQKYSLYDIWNSNIACDNDVISIVQDLLFEKSGQYDSSSHSIRYGDDVNSLSSIGLITLAKRDNIDTCYQWVPIVKSWYMYCYSFIQRVPGTKDDFIDSCSELFENIHILDRCRTSIANIYDDFKLRVLFHLDGLNRNLRLAQVDGRNRSDVLVRLSQLSNFDERASLEGEAARKASFTYEVGGESICCEPHIKLCYSDKYPGDSKYYFNRIYFHEGRSNLCGGKIIVGHIGEHL